MDFKRIVVLVILIALLLIAPDLAGAVLNIDNTVPVGCQNVSPSIAREILKQKGVFVLDVRTPAEYKNGHIEGAKLIPLKNVPSYDPVSVSDSQLLLNRMGELPKNKTAIILVYCKSGKRGSDACQLIVNAGYKSVYNIQGGLESWVNAGYPIVFDLQNGYSLSS
jgi:rhodanese-related sulfurtransferase